MKRWRFAFENRWFGYLALATAFAVGCVLLGQWQFARREEALAEIARIDANYDSAPVALSAVLNSPESFNPDQEWTPVRHEGRYLTDDQLLVRSRPYAGQPGFEVLTPLQLDDGGVFIVNRGWIPTGAEQDSPDAVPTAPSGDVTVIARLKPGEPTLPGRSAPEGQIPTIHLQSIADQLGPATYTGAYGSLAMEDPAPAEAPPAEAPRPVRDEGPHLSYALQWLVFAAFGFIGLGYALRTEYRLRNADAPEEQARAAEQHRKAREKPLDDGAIEDAIVETARR